MSFIADILFAKRPKAISLLRREAIESLLRFLSLNRSKIGMMGILCSRHYTEDGELRIYSNSSSPNKLYVFSTKQSVLFNIKVNQENGDAKILYSAKITISCGFSEILASNCIDIKSALRDIFGDSVPLENGLEARLVA